MKRKNGRPKKQRMVDGVPLVDNLYAAGPTRYLYIKPDGKRKTFACDSPIEANRLATEANKRRDEYTPEEKDDSAPNEWTLRIDDFIAFREQYEPAMPVNQETSWRDRKYYMHQFGRHFSHIPPSKITREDIREWFNDQSAYQQGNRFAEFRRLFNWLMDYNHCGKLEFNPFTTDNGRVQLQKKQPPDKARDPITLKGFWDTYERAGEKGYVGLQFAMLISLYTTMRQGDILRLTFDQVVNGQLRVVIGKSEKQRGAAKASRLAWNLDEYPELAQVIKDARESSMRHMRCPYITHHKGVRNRKSKDKTHECQMLKRFIGGQFAECRPASATPTTFHEIRALSSVIFRQCGYDIKEIQKLMAHTEVSTTLGYQDQGDLPFDVVEIRLTDEALRRA